MRYLVVLVLVSCGVDESNVPYDGVHLSTEGLYECIDHKLIAPDVIELQPAYALWSDGAVKRRWMLLPPGGVIDTRDMDHWQVPVGTKLFKEFIVDGKRIETRVIERTATDYRFTPYQWLDDESDAVVTNGADDVRGTEHDIPNKEVCIACHQSEPGRTLGVSAVQLSGMLDQLPLSDPPSRTFEVPHPALGVLHANCGHCHTTGGVAAFQQLRFSVTDAGLPIEQTAPYRSIVGAPLVEWQQPPLQYRVVPGHPEASAIHVRMASREVGVQMPPMATELVEESALRIVDDWIRSLR